MTRTASTGGGEGSQRGSLIALESYVLNVSSALSDGPAGSASSDAADPSIAINTFNMIVLLSYFRTLPVELEEAAVIDGANDLQVLRHVILPISTPVVMTLTLFYAVENWNLFLPAIFFINDGNKQPLQVILRDMIWSMQLMTQTASSEQFERLAGIEALKAASVFIAALPMLVLYPFIQRYFIRGVMLGAIKE